MPTNSTTPDYKYRKFGDAYIVPADTPGATNLLHATKGRVRYIQLLASGTITFRHDDDTLSVPIPVKADTSYELGLDVVHIMATDTAFGGADIALQIIPYWA